MPDRDRIDYSHVSDNKERRRLRSQDNARLYRDREKQKIMDLETSIEFLMQNNSRLTIQNTTLKYKFEVLKAHIEEARKNKFDQFGGKRQVFDDSTQIREDPDNTQQSLRIAESSMDRTMDTTAEASGFNQYSRDRIGLNDDSEICAVIHDEKPGNKKTGEVEPTSLGYEWQNSGMDDKRGNVGKKRNHKNLSLHINDSNKTASSTSSQQTVVDALLINNRTSTSGILTPPDTGIEAQIGQPVHTSSKIMFDPNQKTPSCYGSAEPSPADEILQKPEMISQGMLQGGFSMHQQLQQVQACQQAQLVQQVNQAHQIQEVQNTHFTF
jgi:hypothetical protein